jgi:glutathione S-transferase
MKLYFSPSACSLSPNIVAHEAGLPLTLDKVDMKTKQTASGKDFLAINPKGYVPVLELDDGKLLTEGPAIVQYLADQRPDTGLAPAAGTFDRYRLQEMLGFLNSEIHKTYSPLFRPTTPAETRAERVETLLSRYAILEKGLAGKSYLFGDHFSVADAYLFTVTRWGAFVKVDLSAFPNLAAFQERVAARPAVKAALEAEQAAK